MSAEYDFYSNPIPHGSNRKPRLHARIVTNGTIGTEDLAKEIQARCSLTTGDILATLVSLSKVITEHLRDGDRVHIPKRYGQSLVISNQWPSVRRWH